MKFKGKKAIMAAALSAIVAASSFGTAITASAETEYAVSVTSNIMLGGFSAYYLSDQNGNTNKRHGKPNVTYTQRLGIPGNSGKMLYKVWIQGDEGSAVYPNFYPSSDSTYDYTFVMPARHITIEAVFIDAPDPDTSKPTPPTPTPNPSPTWKRGDVNLDGYVNAKDATAVLKHVVGLEKLTGQSLINADVNGDGYINAKDATEILKIVIGIG